MTTRALKSPAAIFLLVSGLFVPSLVFAASSVPAPDPIYQLFDDESDRMVINQIPLELDPVSLGFDARAEERMKKVLNPAFVEAALSHWLDQRVVSDLTGVSVDAPPPTKTESGAASPSLPVLMERARGFQLASLAPVAREQFSYILRLYPKNKEVSQALTDLTSAEFKQHMKAALSAQKTRDLDTALVHVNLALSISPKEADALDLKKKLIQEQKLKHQLSARVNQDYVKGVEFYQAGKLDLALASFVRVLNLDPAHKGALDYVQKIGDRIKAGKP